MATKVIQIPSLLVFIALAGYATVQVTNTARSSIEQRQDDGLGTERGTCFGSTAHNCAVHGLGADPLHEGKDNPWR
jgi:hypothetical protein